MKIAMQSGISFVEILVTLTIISLLGAAACPSMQAFIANNRARTVSDEFLSSLYRTRSEAVKRANKVTLCASNTAQTACDGSAANFSNGWVIFTDYNDNGVLDIPTTLFDATGSGVEDTPEELLFASGKPSGDYVIAITVNTTKLQNRLTYNSNGLPDFASFGIGYIISDDGSVSTQHARIAIGMTGRIRSCIGNSTKCPAP